MALQQTSMTSVLGSVRDEGGEIVLGERQPVRLAKPIFFGLSSGPCASLLFFQPAFQLARCTFFHTGVSTLRNQTPRASVARQEFL